MEKIPPSAKNSLFGVINVGLFLQSSDNTQQPTAHSTPRERCQQNTKGVSGAGSSQMCLRSMRKYLPAPACSVWSLPRAQSPRWGWNRGSAGSILMGTWCGERDEWTLWSPSLSVTEILIYKGKRLGIGNPNSFSKSAYFLCREIIMWLLGHNVNFY